MRPTEVTVPDELWRNRSLPDRAKLLWCYLCARGETRRYGFCELRKALRISQNSLLKYLVILGEQGWLRYRKAALREAVIEVTGSAAGQSVRVPTDLIFDRDFPRAAVWVWCVIRRHACPFDYKWLQGATGYTQATLSKYLGQLRAAGWLHGVERRVNRFVEFQLKANNPHDVKRRAEIAEIEQGVKVARQTKGYSAGQYTLARMVKLRLASGTVIENAEITGLDNPETGGRMHYDILIPQYKVALEFHGPQHFGPTERFSDPVAYKQQRTRDLIKRGLSDEQATKLLTISAADLRFERLDELLSPYVPLRTDMDDQWHIYKHLKRLAAEYRSKAARAKRPS